MSTDPFDEAPHDRNAVVHRVPPSPMTRVSVHHSPAPSTENVFATLAATSPTNTNGTQPRKSVTLKNVAQHDPHADTSSTPALAVLHRRGISNDALSSCDNSRNLALPMEIRHARTATHELDDHMIGSIYAPNELCPKCGFPRANSVYCPVSKLHHGTEEPMPEVKELKEDDVDRHAAAASVAPDADSGGAATETPKKKGWSLFKTKEEKELAALEDEEDAARKRIGKSRSNVEGERFSRETLRNVFITGLEELVKFEKTVHSIAKLETEKRNHIVNSEESDWRTVAKEGEKIKKKVAKAAGSKPGHIDVPSASADADSAAAATASAGPLSPLSHSGSPTTAGVTAENSIVATAEPTPHAGDDTASA
jgi:uncharacterized Zn finger protein (UPF0148 family)